MLLLEEGFEVVSVDASDKMLKQAYKTRWDRRKEDIYDKWGEMKLWAAIAAKFGLNCLC